MDFAVSLLLDTLVNKKIFSSCGASEFLTVDCLWYFCSRFIICEYSAKCAGTVIPMLCDTVPRSSFYVSHAFGKDAASIFHWIVLYNPYKGHKIQFHVLNHNQKSDSASIRLHGWFPLGDRFLLLHINRFLGVPLGSCLSLQSTTTRRRVFSS